MLAVGSILVATNHGHALVDWDFSWHLALRILLTMAVPYMVSTLSSVAAIRERGERDGG